jgi:hypothetical protein
MGTPETQGKFFLQSILAADNNVGKANTKPPGRSISTLQQEATQTSQTIAVNLTSQQR